jgi:aminodeoxyfutalosine deaminase
VGKVNKNNFWDLPFQSLNFAVMHYLKFRADQLFDGNKLFGDDKVLVVSDDGTVREIISRRDAGDDVQYNAGILSPGFINCHCHLELSHMKGQIPEGIGLVSFVTQVIKNRFQREDRLTTAIEDAENEMIDSGIVAVGDICNNTSTVPQKSKLRIAYHNFIEASGFPPSVAETRFQRAVDIFNEYAAHSEKSSNSIVPHAPYSVSPELWQKIISFPGNQLLTIHNQETFAEDELFLYKKGEFLDLYQNLNIDVSFFEPSGKSSLQSYIPWFLDNQQVILVHNVHTTYEDLAHYKMQSRLNADAPFKFWLCLCFNANLYITGKLPDLDMIRRHTDNVVLGTDSLASNHQLSILTEMQTIYRHFPSVSLEQLFRWATLNGAKALQMDNILGSFEPGKKPGVVLSSSDLSQSRRLM